MPGCLYATPADNVVQSATPSLTVGTANAAFPLTNIDDIDPGVVFKATTGTATIRFTFGGATVLVAIAMFNHNLHGLTPTWTNNGGMATQNFPVPTVPEDLLGINPWLDLRGVAGTSATQWNLVISGAPNAVAIGDIALLTALRDLKVPWQYKHKEHHPTIIHRTEKEKRLIFPHSVRTRMFSGEAIRFEDRAAVRSLRRSAQGAYKPWVFIPDSAVNDALLVQFADDDTGEETYEYVDPARTTGIVRMPVSLEEVQSGLAL